MQKFFVGGWCCFFEGYGISRIPPQLEHWSQVESESFAQRLELSRVIFIATRVESLTRVATNRYKFRCKMKFCKGGKISFFNG